MDPESFPGILGMRQEYILYETPIYHHAHIHSHTHPHLGAIHLKGKRKLENLETHMEMESIPLELGMEP